MKSASVTAIEIRKGIDSVIEQGGQETSFSDVLRTLKDHVEGRIQE